MIARPIPEILYQDEELIAVNKPSNLLSVPGRGPDKQDCVSKRVQAVYPSAEIVHRLDYDTSGILLMALNKNSQSALGRQFQQREIEKYYIAVVHGRPDQLSGTIDLPMRCDFERRPLQIIDHHQGKQAMTHWQLIDSDRQSSRLLLKPVTGRSHQLRLHLKNLGHPILGDNLYGSQTSYAMADRLLLHARQIRFVHPATGAMITINSVPEF